MLLKIGDYKTGDTTTMLRSGLSRANQLNLFLADVEKRAWRVAVVAVNNPDDAADIAQDSMLALVEKYSHKPPTEWPPLFWRILNNKIKDHLRRHKVKQRWLSFIGNPDEQNNENPLEQLHSHDIGPLELLGAEVTAGDAYLAIQQLPNRQREAFCLRVWEGMDVTQTATAMGCSAGSVKTHLHRALENLRQKLGAALETLPEGASS